MTSLILTILAFNLLVLVLAALRLWHTRHEPERRTPRPDPWCATYRKEPKP